MQLKRALSVHAFVCSCPSFQKRQGFAIEKTEKAWGLWSGGMFSDFFQRSNIAIYVTNQKLVITEKCIDINANVK